MSNFRVEVVPVVMQKHPDADSLSVVDVFDGYTCVVRTEDWLGVTHAAYVPPDSIVPDTEQYAFLEGHRKIKARRLRGIQSYGMLVPAPEGSQVGDDVAEVLNIVHYEPEMNAELVAGENAMNPPMAGKDYEIEAWHKYRNEFVEGEEVIITEKIHGTNSRYTYQNGQMYCGSHYNWKREGKGLYWDALKFAPWIEAFCRLNPDVILFGEIFGAVQKGYNYGSDQNNPYQFRAFDIFAETGFLDYDDALGGAQSDFLVPVLYRGPYSHAVVEELMNGKSMMPGATHIREGVIIKPTKERYSRRLHGRLILKAVSVDYLAGKKKK